MAESAVNRPVPGARDVAVEFFTLSKSYNMAGWRIGFMVGNKTLVSALARIKSYHEYGTFTPLQVAAIAALEGDRQCVRDVANSTNAAVMYWLKGCMKRAGWLKCRRLRCMSGRKSRNHMRPWDRWNCQKLLNEAKVCVSPGSALATIVIRISALH
ncbi:aminotransferase class I/II-fold pyridoxal phosphate-dependent enzyme [Escherichia coli]